MQTRGAGKPWAPPLATAGLPPKCPGQRPNPASLHLLLLCPGSRLSGRPPTPSANLKGNKYKLYKVKGSNGARGGPLRASHHPQLQQRAGVGHGLDVGMRLWTRHTGTDRDTDGQL